MGVPRHHLAKGKQGRRRSHLALKAKSLSKCSNCGKVKNGHIACKACGYYRGRMVVDVAAKTLKKQQKKQAKNN